jgi:hypothetical protein
MVLNQKDVLSMFEKGLSVSGIAGELEVTPSEIRAVLIEAGLIAKQGRKLTTDSLSEEEITDLLADYVENGVPAVQIIAKYSITWNALYKLLDDHGVPYREMKHEDKVARELRLERAVAMYVGGARIWEIETETGIRQPVLHATLHARNIPLRRQAQGQD